MRTLKKIAICGSQGQGKTTLINDMIQHWKKFSTPEKTYRDFIIEKKLPINKKATSESQKAILDCLVDSVMEPLKEGEKRIYDRCPLDNLVYSLWHNQKGTKGFTDEYIASIIPIVRESLKVFDMIFFIPITKHHEVICENKNDLRDIDANYKYEIDSIFKALFITYKQDQKVFFPADDCPAIIEIFGDRETRIKMLELYITEDAEIYGEKDSLIATLGDIGDPTPRDFY